jgi:hypothetical protein
MNFKLNQENLKIGFYAILGIIAVFIIYRFTRKTGEALNIFDTKEEKEAEKTTKKAIEDFAKDAAKRSKPTRSAAQWALVADSIYNALKSSAAGDDKGKAYTELAKILTDADMSLVLASFGARQEYAFGVPIGRPKTLVQFVQDNFDLKDIADLNKLYSRSNMRFKF